MDEFTAAAPDPSLARGACRSKVKYALFSVFALLGCSRAADIAADHPAPLASASTSAPVASSVALAPPPAPATNDDDDLREATLRHMFKKNASALQQSAKVYCLAFENKVDPPAAFIARFAHDATPVVAGSGCKQDHSGVFDKATKAHGLSFRIDVVKYADKDHATVNGGYYEAGLSASGNVYTVERQKGAWVVVKDEMTWIS